MSSSVQLQAYVEKLQSSDIDVRLAALQHLTNDLGKNAPVNQDAKLETQLVRRVVALLSDQNDEIKDQACKCAGQLVQVVRSPQIDYIVDRLIELLGHTNGELRGIAGLALKCVMADLPQDGVVAPRVVRKIVPALLQQSTKLTAPVDTLIETLATLDIVLSRFQAHVSSGVPTTLIPLLCHTHSGIRKRAVNTIASFVSHLSDPEIQAFVTSKITPGLVSPATPVDEKCTTLRLVSALARYVAPSLGEIIPSVFTGIEEGDEKLKRSGLQALEKLITHCSSHMAPYTSQLVDLGVKYVEYGSTSNKEPGNEEVSGANSGQVPEDNDIGESGSDSDDEDAPCMVRRSAIKLLGAVIGARPEMLSALYKTVAPVLLSSFCDVEPTVCYEAWSAFAVLFRQTRLVFSDKSNFVPANWGKFEPLPATKKVLTAVDSLVPRLLKAMVKILSPRATLPRPALELFNALLSPLPKGSPTEHVFTSGYQGALHSHTDLEEDLFLLLAQPTTLTTFSHMLSVGWPGDNALVKLTTLMGDSDTRVASDAIRIGLRILGDLSDLSSDNEFGQALQDAARELLGDSGTDAGVRKLACKTISALLVHGFSCDEEDWELVRNAGAARIIQETIWDTSKRNNERYEMAEEWLEPNITWCVESICREGEKGNEILDKGEIISCLVTLLCEGFSLLDSDSESSLAIALPTHITPKDPALEPTLRLLNVLYSNRPGKWWKYIQPSMLRPLCSLASERLRTASLDALAQLMCKLAQKNGESDPDEYEEDEDMDEEDEDRDEEEDEDVDEDEDQGEEAPRATKKKMDATNTLLSELMAVFQASEGSAHTAKGVSECLAAVVRGQRYTAAKIVEDFSANIKPATNAPEGLLMLSLLTLGEIGRYVDAQTQQSIFDDLLSLLSSKSEDIRNAATQAIGSMCDGSPAEFVPIVIDQTKTNKEQRPLFLCALEVFISKCNSYTLENKYAEIIWSSCWDLPLLDENALGPSARCLSKLLAKNPTDIRPRLEAKLQDPSPIARALAVSTMGCAFQPGSNISARVDDESSHEENNEDEDESDRSYPSEDKAAKPLKVALESFVAALLPSLDDKDLNVRTRALVSMNDAVRSEPQFVDGHLTALLPKLRDACRLKTEGTGQALDVKRAAYETLNALMSTTALVAKLDLDMVLTAALHGLSDNSNEIKMLCHTIVRQLSKTAPSIIAPRMKEIAAILDIGPSRDREVELTRSMFRMTAGLNEVAGLRGNGTIAFPEVVEGDGMDVS